MQKILGCQKSLKVSAWSDGLRLVEPTDRREYWSVDKKASIPLAINPILQYHEFD
jgi:hypothetical protein